jgi:AraC-like DNA-binding protein
VQDVNVIASATAVRPTAVRPDRFTYGEQWREALSGAFGNLAAERVDRDDAAPDLAGWLTAATLGRAGAFTVAGTPQIVRRTRQAISLAGGGPLKVCIQQSGSAVVHQGETEIALSPGQLAIYDTAQPYDIRLNGHWRCAVMTVPRDALALPRGALATVMERSIAADSGPGVVLTQLLTTCADSLDAQTEYDAGERLGEAGIELLASLFCGTTTFPSSDDAQRERILHYVRGHLSDPDLCHATVAAAHNLSTRTLHRLFESEPTTITETIRALRLEAIHADLASPQLSRRGVMFIASRWGFRDQAHFTRSFRARFGITPARHRRESERRRAELGV